MRTDFWAEEAAYWEGKVEKSRRISRWVGVVLIAILAAWLLSRVLVSS